MVRHLHSHHTRRPGRFRTLLATSALSALVLVPAGCSDTASVAPPAVLANSKIEKATDRASITVAFAAGHDDTEWPVPSAPRTDISSTFGPRIRQSTDAYDFHRGIDIHAPIGAAVVAAQPGILYGVRTFDAGGLTVIVEHQLAEPVEFHGHTTDTFYTFYMHLSAVADAVGAAGESGERLAIAAGDRIGAVGISGQTVSAHLHFEVRLGSQCSLEFQLEHPDASCASLGADPHIHPLVLFAPAPTDLRMEVIDGAPDAERLIAITTNDHHPGASRYVLEARQAGQVTHRYVLDLDTRTGFNAETNRQLDQPDELLPHLRPQSFTHRSDEWTMHYVIPKDSVPGEPDSYRLTVIDAWGASNSLNMRPER